MSTPRELTPEEREREAHLKALRILADSESWSGDPLSQESTLYGHDTPYELAVEAIAAGMTARRSVEVGEEKPNLDTSDITITLPRKDAEWLLAQVGKLTRREVSHSTYEALCAALGVES